MYKINNQILIDKGLIGENIFIWGEEIQIWIGKDSMRILEGLINLIEDLIAGKINFLSQFGC
jgi:hypothetical protein